MKKNTIFITLLALFNICVGYSQKITKNEIDDFTGNRIIETSYTTISDGFPCYLKQVNNSLFLNAGFNGGNKIYTMLEGDSFMLKLDNDEIVTLQNSEAIVSEYYSTSIGSTHISHYTLRPKMQIDEEDLKKLQTNKITKVRFDTQEGYIERNVSKNNATKLQKMFNLIQF